MIWSVESGQIAYNCISEDAISDIIHCEPYLIVSFKDLPTKFLNLKSGKEFTINWKMSSIRPEDVRISSVLLDNQYVYLGFTNGTIGIFDTTGDKREIVLRVGNSNRIEGMKLSEDKLRLIAESKPIFDEEKAYYINHVWIFHLFWDYDFCNSGAPTLDGLF
jgi:hypothetical protein